MTLPRYLPTVSEQRAGPIADLPLTLNTLVATVRRLGNPTAADLSIALDRPLSTVRASLTDACVRGLLTRTETRRYRARVVRYGVAG